MYSKSICKSMIFTFMALLLTNSANATESQAKKELQALLNQHQGKVVYIDFWASWCVPCRKSFPWMNDIQQKYQDKGLAVISINVDNDKTYALKFLEEVPANFPIIYDPKGIIARSYKLKGMPSSFIINRQGQLVSSHVGFNQQKKVQYEHELLNLLSNNNNSQVIVR